MPGGDAAIPSELADDRRKEQRERRPRIDADRHGDERHHDDQPAVEEGKMHWGIFALGVRGANACFSSHQRAATCRRSPQKGKRNTGLAVDRLTLPNMTSFAIFMRISFSS
jgi:hypothetical protein